MQSLCEKLNINRTINNIKAKTLKDAVVKSFKSDIYDFRLNSELIDVNNRFKIFRYNNINWIAKKSKKYKAVFEQENAIKAQEKLDGAIINGKIVKVLKPVYFEDGDQGYLLTEYISNSLQEYLYSNYELNFTFQDLKALLELLDKNNMVFRGLLPRNIMVYNNIIYLIDWEDVLFYNKRSEAYLNMQFKTNFLLNWGYFFNHNDLELLLSEINKTKKVNEPDTNKYEKIFNSFQEQLIDVKLLREKILNIVLFAEKDIKDNSKDFVIKPNDMAHLISDIFTDEVDVLFDLCVFALRRNNEDTYVKLLFALSNQIAVQYSERYINKSSLIVYILLMLDNNFLKEIDNKLMDIDGVIKLIKNRPEIICWDYLYGDFTLCKNKLKNKINDISKSIDESFICNDEFCDKLFEFLIGLKEKRYFLTTIFEDLYFELVQKQEFVSFPRFYVLKQKQPMEKMSYKIVEELSKFQKIIREVYSSYGVKQVGIYTEYQEGKMCVNFIPYYQKVLKKFKIDPDDYQPYLEIYLKNCKVDMDQIVKINKDMNIRINKGLKKYE